jgi:hypothetical protein
VNNTPLFSDKQNQPTDAVLSSVLSDTQSIWNEIRTAIEKEHGHVVEEWKFYGTKIGWTLKLLHKKRNLLFLTAHNGYFMLSFVFGEKAVKEVEKSTVSEKIKSDLKNARKYAEGRGIRIEVKKRSQIGTVVKLVAIKLNN